jgi:acetyl-CoA/propionyl-CoA carboxylase biotin carboxyl carrier protein
MTTSQFVPSPISSITSSTSASLVSLASSNLNEMSIPRISSVLVANRGEIAVRIMRTLRMLGIKSVAVYSDVDRDALHVRMADRALPIGAAPAAQSYLRGDVIIAAAVTAGVDAIHPGYGFLSENAEFARECARAGLIFVGPGPDAIAEMGDKIAARHRVAAAGVPVVPGVGAPGMSDAELITAAEEIGYPILIKPSAGGGGKGMHQVSEAEGMKAALAAARREASSSFGDDTLLLERVITRPRHIEVQILCDEFGNAVHLGERECSLQRRHQKIIEEAPSVLLTPAARERLGSLAIQAARACGYVNAGTVEFICSSDKPEDFYFIEMNTRLQVEHPVTEQVWGVDLVAAQIRIAAGQSLGFTQEDLVSQGHAVEARIYAEDPTQGFVPSPGKIVAVNIAQDISRNFSAGGHPGIRVDTGFEAGDSVSGHYDPMIAKVIATGADRAEAIQRLQAALLASRVVGVATNLAFVSALLDLEAVKNGDLHTELVDEFAAEMAAEAQPPREAIMLAALGLHLWPQSSVRSESLLAPWTDSTGWRVGLAAETHWRVAVPTVVGVVDSNPTKMVVGITVNPSGSAAAIPGFLKGSGSFDQYTLRIDGGEPVPVSVRLCGVDHSKGSASISAMIGGQNWTAQLDRDEASGDDEAGSEGLWLSGCGLSWFFGRVRLNDRQQLGVADASGKVVSPMPGTVVAVMVMEGESVTAGQPLVVVEAMKMEHTMCAGVDGTVRQIQVLAGDRTQRGAVLIEIEPAAIAPLEMLEERRSENIDSGADPAHES